MPRAKYLTVGLFEGLNFGWNEHVMLNGMVLLVSSFEHMCMIFLLVSERGFYTEYETRTKSNANSGTQYLPQLR